MKYALINEDTVSAVERFMPSNYAAVALGEFVLVFGEDQAGWTLDGYVLPRLASGLYYPARDAQVEYRDGTFSLIDPDDRFGPPVEEVRVFTQYDWEATVNNATLDIPEGYDEWDSYFVEQEVQDILRDDIEFEALDPAFDFEAAADYANHRLNVDGLLADEEA